MAGRYWVGLALGLSLEQGWYLVCDTSEEDSRSDNFWSGYFAGESMPRKCLCAFHFYSEGRSNAKQLRSMGRRQVRYRYFLY